MPELIERVLEQSGYIESLEAERTIEAQGRIENLQELVALAREWVETAAEPTLSSFLQEVSLYSDQDAIRGEGSLVTLMTLHNAKGLEFRAVYLIGMEEGIFPHSRSIEEQGDRGGAPPLLRRHDARDGAADAAARLVAHALRRPLVQPAVALPRRAARTRTSSATACSPPRGRTTARRGRARSRRATTSRRSRRATAFGTARSAKASSRASSRAASSPSASRTTATERRLMLDYAPLEKL